MKKIQSIVTKGPTDGRKKTRRRVLAGSNAQCEQCNHTHTDSQHCECYRIVVQPMQPLLHGAPPCSASSSKRAAEITSRAALSSAVQKGADRGNAVVPGPRHLICIGRLIVVDIWS